VKQHSMCLLLLGLVSFVDSVRPAYSQQRTLTVVGDELVIEVVDTRPLSVALQMISEENPLDLTYEDPRYTYRADIQDVTLAVRSDLHLYEDLDDAPRVLVPRPAILYARLPISNRSTDSAEWVAALETLVEAQNTSDSAGHFRVMESSGAIHVLPVASRDATGKYVPHAALLDTRITILAQAMSGLEMFSEICKAISIASGGVFSTEPDTALNSTLKPLRAPLGNFQRHSGMLEARDEPARDVLFKFLRGIDGTSAWQVFVTFDPVYNSYWINVRSIPRPESRVIEERETSRRQSSDVDRASGGFLIPEAFRDQVIERR
jgi:hypothetical protein